MKVTLVRHAHCVDASAWVGEYDRYLTIEGRAAAVRTARVIKARGASPEVILTSPLVRAVQTAELIASEVGYDSEVITTTSLAPGAPSRLLVEELDRRGVGAVAVGHAPDMRARAATLLCRDASELPLFSRAMALCIEEGALIWGYHADLAQQVETLAELRDLFR